MARSGHAAGAPWERRVAMLAGQFVHLNNTAAQARRSPREPHPPPREALTRLFPQRTRAQAAPFVRLSPEVAAALAAHRPVVALESTIISHGMPFPANLATAREVEAAVRAAGAVPATVAVLAGQPCVGASRVLRAREARYPLAAALARLLTALTPRAGLDDAALEQLARLGPEAVKTSRRVRVASPSPPLTCHSADA